jgi:hypothetical protein
MLSYKGICCKSNRLKYKRSVCEFCSFHANMARLNTRSFPCYCGSWSAERGVAFVLWSAAVKKIARLLSTRVKIVFLCLAAILNLRNARVLFIMAKRHHVRKSQFMKAITDIHSFFQEESFKIRNNQQVLRHTAIMERVCACLKVSPLVYGYRKYVENRF